MIGRGPSLIPYGVAVLSVAIATALRLALDPILGTSVPFATLFFAVLFTAWWGGRTPALVASALGAVSSILFLLGPRNALSVDDTEALGGLALFLAMSAGVAAIGGAMHRARQRAERSAREAEARRQELYATLSSIGDGVVTTDTNARVTSLNGVAVELTGWTPDDAVGRPLSEVFAIIDESTRETAPNPGLRALAEGRIVGLDNHALLVARDGIERPIDYSVAPIKERDGKVIGVILVFRDVSERRKSEEQRRRTEQELSDLFENANVGLHQVGSDGTILRANRAELEMLGYSRDEYVGRPIAEFHADPDVIADILRRLSAGETLVGYPARLRCRSGAIKDVLINSSAAMVDGRFRHTRCFTLDVTDRNRAAEAKALLAEVVESSDDAIATKTLDGVVTSWNAGAERLFGFERGEMIGQPISRIIPPDRQHEERSILERLRRGERIEPFDTERVAKSGQRLEISVRISPIRDGTGRIVGASKLARDVTAARRAERALRASEERFHQLTTNAPAAIFVKDLDGRYTLANPLARAVLGCEDTVGRTDHDMLPAEVADALRRVDCEVMALRGPIESEERVQRPGFDRRFLAVRFPFLDETGALVGVCGVSIDITDRHAAEEGLRVANQRKDEFLATLAHELRNPLAPIRSALEIVRRRGIEPHTRQGAEAIMDRQLAHLERLVDDLLDVARITNDRLELRRSRVDLASVIDQAVETCRPLLEAAGLTLELDVGEEPVPLDADATRLAQVFSNLLHNACKYTERGGHIVLEARREAGEAVMWVRDTGRGIAQPMLARVFDLFTQAEPSPHQTQRGLGIGLTLARRFVEMHGGRIQVASEGLGCGSEFTVRLPLARGAGQAASVVEPPVRPSATRRVLVVDDNQDAAEALATLLRIAGHDVLVAHDGEQALDAVRSVRPELVLLDLGLPKLSGHDVARSIRKEPWSADVLLAALTGWDQDADRRRSREAGFDVHLVKPVSLAALDEVFAMLPSRP